MWNRDYFETKIKVKNNTFVGGYHAINILDSFFVGSMKRTKFNDQLTSEIKYRL